MKTIPYLKTCSWRRTIARGVWLLAAPGFAFGAAFAPDQVREAVQSWVRYIPSDARPEAVVERVEPYREDGVTMAYVVQLASGGYCLAGADSLVLPVYFYCPSGAYDPKNPSCRDILKEIADHQRFLQAAVAAGGPVEQAYQAKLSDRARLWADLVSGDAAAIGNHRQKGGPSPKGPLPKGSGPNPSGPVSMKVPVTGQFNQEAPYSDYCPTLPADSGNYTVVGCVATATAQLMYYWQWPNSGVGNGTETYKYRGTSTTLSTPLSFDPGGYNTGFPGGLDSALWNVPALTRLLQCEKHCC